jgi:hypothetical protein
MSRQKSKKPKPKPGMKVAIATKKGAAIGQLESAILLWFNEADAISILVLASNASECFHALGKKLGRPSPVQEYLALKPTAFRERTNYIQNFAKHGFQDLEESAEFSPVIAEMLMIVSVACCEQLFGRATQLMSLFSVRFFLENPSLAQRDFRPMLAEEAIVQNLAGRSRKQFFEEHRMDYPAIFRMK